MTYTEEELRCHRVCFTGHRPEKLTLSENEVKERLSEQIRKAVSEGYTAFISGMAKGVDLWAGQIVADLRGSGSEIRLIAASPYEGFGKGWSPEWRSLYLETLERADLVHYACQEYNKGCFMTRNKWMVDHSSLVLAVYNGEKGGTRNTIDYARKQGIEVRLI